jgi:MFS family permease
MLTAQTQSYAWILIFFIASSAASAAYLTVSELFPLEMRGLAIAIFYAAGTLIGGVAAPAIFAKLIAAGRDHLAVGYYIGAGLMIFAAMTEAVFGVAAEGKSLESITAPLTAQEYS